MLDCRGFATFTEVWYTLDDALHDSSRQKADCGYAATQDDLSLLLEQALRSAEGPYG